VWKKTNLEEIVLSEKMDTYLSSGAFTETEIISLEIVKWLFCWM